MLLKTFINVGRVNVIKINGGVMAAEAEKKQQGKAKNDINSILKNVKVNLTDAQAKELEQLLKSSSNQGTSLQQPSGKGKQQSSKKSASGKSESVLPAAWQAVKRLAKEGEGALKSVFENSEDKASKKNKAKLTPSQKKDVQQIISSLKKVQRTRPQSKKNAQVAPKKQQASPKAGAGEKQKKAATTGKKKSVVGVQEQKVCSLPEKIDESTKLTVSQMSDVLGVDKVVLLKFLREFDKYRDAKDNTSLTMDQWATVFKKVGFEKFAYSWLKHTATFKAMWYHPVDFLCDLPVVRWFVTKHYNVYRMLKFMTQQRRLQVLKKENQHSKDYASFMNLRDAANGFVFMSYTLKKAHYNWDQISYFLDNAFSVDMSVNVPLLHREGKVASPLLIYGRMWNLIGRGLRQAGADDGTVSAVFDNVSNTFISRILDKAKAYTPDKSMFQHFVWKEHPQMFKLISYLHTQHGFIDLLNFDLAGVVFLKDVVETPGAGKQLASKFNEVCDEVFKEQLLSKTMGYLRNYSTMLTVLAGSYSSKNLLSDPDRVADATKRLKQFTDSFNKYLEDPNTQRDFAILFTFGYVNLISAGLLSGKDMGKTLDGLAKYSAASLVIRSLVNEVQSERDEQSAVLFASNAAMCERSILWLCLNNKSGDVNTFLKDLANVYATTHSEKELVKALSTFRAKYSEIIAKDVAEGTKLSEEQIKALEQYALIFTPTQLQLFIHDGGAAALKEAEKNMVEQMGLDPQTLVNPPLSEDVLQKRIAKVANSKFGKLLISKGYTPQQTYTLLASLAPAFLWYEARHYSDVDGAANMFYNLVSKYLPTRKQVDIILTDKDLAPASRNEVLLALELFHKDALDSSTRIVQYRGLVSSGAIEQLKILLPGISAKAVNKTQSEFVATNEILGKSRVYRMLEQKLEKGGAKDPKEAALQIIGALADAAYKQSTTLNVQQLLKVINDLKPNNDPDKLFEQIASGLGWNIKEVNRFDAAAVLERVGQGRNARWELILNNGGALFYISRLSADWTIDQVIKRWHADMPAAVRRAKIGRSKTWTAQAASGVGLQLALLWNGYDGRNKQVAERWQQVRALYNQLQKQYANLSWNEIKYKYGHGWLGGLINYVDKDIPQLNTGTKKKAFFLAAVSGWAASTGYGNPRYRQRMEVFYQRHGYKFSDDYLSFLSGQGTVRYGSFSDLRSLLKYASLPPGDYYIVARAPNGRPIILAEIEVKQKQQIFVTPTSQNGKLISASSDIIFVSRSAYHQMEEFEKWKNGQSNKFDPSAHVEVIAYTSLPYVASYSNLFNVLFPRENGEVLSDAFPAPELGFSAHYNKVPSFRANYAYDFVHQHSIRPSFPTITKTVIPGYLNVMPLAPPPNVAGVAYYPPLVGASIISQEMESGFIESGETLSGGRSSLGLQNLLSSFGLSSGASANTGSIMANVITLFNNTVFENPGLTTAFSQALITTQVGNSFYMAGGKVLSSPAGYNDYFECKVVDKDNNGQVVKVEVYYVSPRGKQKVGDAQYVLKNGKIVKSEAIEKKQGLNTISFVLSDQLLYSGNVGNVFFSVRGRAGLTAGALTTYTNHRPHSVERMLFVPTYTIASSIFYHTKYGTLVFNPYLGAGYYHMLMPFGGVGLTLSERMFALSGGVSANLLHSGAPVPWAMASMRLFHHWLIGGGWSALGPSVEIGYFTDKKKFYGMSLIWAQKFGIPLVDVNINGKSLLDYPESWVTHTYNHLFTGAGALDKPN